MVGPRRTDRGPRLRELRDLDAAAGRRGRGRALPDRAHRRREPVGAPDGARRRAAPGDGGPIATDRGPRADRRSTAAACTGITYATPVPTAQVKSAVLLAGLDAEGATTVARAGAHPRPHRAWRSPRSGVPVERDGTSVTIEPVPARGLRGPRAGRPVVGRVPRRGGRPDGLGADDHGRRAQPEPHPLPGRDGADGRAHRDARRPRPSSASPSATSGSRRATACARPA